MNVCHLTFKLSSFAGALFSLHSTNNCFLIKNAYKVSTNLTGAERGGRDEDEKKEEAF
jgi:hypothetical protein